MLLERRRRIDDEFLLLNTFNEARRFAGFVSTADIWAFLLVSLFGLNIVARQRDKGKTKFISFGIGLRRAVV